MHNRFRRHGHQEPAPGLVVVFRSEEQSAVDRKGAMTIVVSSGDRTDRAQFDTRFVVGNDGEGSWPSGEDNAFGTDLMHHRSVSTGGNPQAEAARTSKIEPRHEMLARRIGTTTDESDRARNRGYAVPA